MRHDKELCLIFPPPHGREHEINRKVPVLPSLGPRQVGNQPGGIHDRTTPQRHVNGRSDGPVLSIDPDLRTDGTSCRLDLDAGVVGSDERERRAGDKLLIRRIDQHQNRAAVLQILPLRHRKLCRKVAV